MKKSILFFIALLSMHSLSEEYHGNIDGIAITMNLDIRENEINGYYSYNKYGTRISLEGRISQSKINIKTLGSKDIEYFTGYVSMFDPKFQTHKDIEIVIGYWKKNSILKKFMLEKGRYSGTLDRVDC